MAKAAPETFVGETPNMAPSMAHLALTEELRASNLSLNSKRSLFLDEDRFENQFLRCGICKERFHNESLPRMLPCHHSFCHACISDGYRLACEQRDELSGQSAPTSYRPLTTPPVNMNCPMCDTTFLATEDTIRSLPADHRVVQLMDFVNHTERCTVTFCSKHTQLPINFFCEKCIKPACRDCTAELHKEEEGCDVTDLEEALAKHTPMLDKVISDMDAESGGIEEKRNTLDSVTKSIDNVKVELLGQVKSCFTRLRELLDEREKALEEKVKNDIENEKSKLLEKSNMLTTRREFFTEKSAKLKAAKEEKNVEEMFDLHQEVRDFRASAPTRIREVDDGLMTSFMLNTRDEAMLASRIGNFGDVITKVETTSSRNKTSSVPSSFSNVYRSSSYR